MTEAIRANPRRLDHLISKPAGREMLLYDPTTDVVHVLNATARLVWNLSDAQHSPADIAASLRAGFSFSTQNADVLADVSRVLERFEAEGLIAWSAVHDSCGMGSHRRGI